MRASPHDPPEIKRKVLLSYRKKAAAVAAREGSISDTKAKPQTQWRSAFVPTQNRVLDGIFSKRPEEREIEERLLQRMTAAHLEHRKGIVHLAEALMSGKFDSVLQPLASKEVEAVTERFSELESFSLSGRRRKPQ